MKTIQIAMQYSCRGRENPPIRIFTYNGDIPKDVRKVFMGSGESTVFVVDNQKENKES